MKKIPWIPLRLMALSIFVVLAVFASPARGDVYRILEDPQEAAQARVDLIQQAKVEVDALYFLARNDRITQTALSLLRDASRRGIRVRLIVDARFNHLPGSMLVYLRDEGVAVRVYHPFSFRHLPWIFRRMHDKVVVADDKRYVAGGRNLDEAYFGLNPKRNYIDRDVYIEGPSAADADLHFDQLWASRHVADIHAIVSQSEKDQAARLLDAARSSLAARGFVRFDTGTDWSAGRPRQIPVRFLHDPIDAGKGPRVAESLTAVFDTAKQSIVIETPYLIPSRLFINLIARKLQEGVSIRIITNSMKSTDGLLPQVAYLRYRRNLVRWGVEVYEFKGPNTLHAKSAAIDGKIALIGSYNLDPRSQNLNTELMCLADDEGEAKKLLENIDVHVRDAWKIPRSGNPPRNKHYPGTTLGMRFLMWTTRLLLPFIEGQL